MVTRVRNGAAAAIGCLLLASAALADSPFIPNSIKYNDSGIKPASGRSGGATIEARALIGKDGVGAVEVTSDGNLEKVQVKRVAADVTSNFTGLSGNTFTATVDGLVLDESVQVQANVTGVDGARMDVVTATTTVALRPDLAVTAVTAAPHAVANGPVRIGATIRELNGDTGARASCVLSVAGMDVDRADDIWVDAGSSVSCSFLTTFASAGEKSFSVRVENIRPGDDDASNNSADGSMKVYAMASEFTYWTVSANQSRSTSHTTVTGPWGASEETRSGIDGDSVMYTFINENVGLANLVISTRESTEGELIHETNGVPLDITPGQWYGEPTCAFAFQNYQMFIMCDIPLADHQPRSFWMEVWRMSGWVTYHSTGWNTTIPSDQPPGYYTWNTQSSGGYGSQKPLGSTFEWQLAISNGTRLWETSGVMPLATSSGTSAPPPYCFAVTGGQQCTQTVRTYVTKQGFATSWPGY